MSYLELALWFTAAAVLMAVIMTLLARGRGIAVGRHIAAIGATAAALVVLTAVFDSIMIWADLFYYAPEMLVGLHIGLAPIEDFSYPVAGAILLPSLWVLLRGRSRRTVTVSTDQATDRTSTDQGEPS